jgi:hypothetical protein
MIFVTVEVTGRCKWSKLQYEKLRFSKGAVELMKWSYKKQMTSVKRHCPFKRTLQSRSGSQEGQILSPWLGDIVDSDIRLSYWPASLCCRYDNMPEPTISPSQGLRIWLQLIHFCTYFRQWFCHAPLFPPIFALFFFTSAGILEQHMRARNRVGIGLSYRPARPQRLAESIHWNRFPKRLYCKYVSEL